MEKEQRNFEMKVGTRRLREILSGWMRLATMGIDSSGGYLELANWTRLILHNLLDKIDQQLNYIDFE